MKLVSNNLRSIGSLAPGGEVGGTTRTSSGGVSGSFAWNKLEQPKSKFNPHTPA